MKLLLIEDDESIITALKHHLAAHHYVMDAVTDGETGWVYATTYEYDLIILDIVLPKMNGIHFCERFREEGYTTPILVLTAQATSLDKVRGLDAGADDYVVKPFDVNELSARIRALLRRGKASPFPLLMWEDLILNPSTYEVTYQDKPLVLTIKEYELLELFLRDSRHVFSSEEILDKLWTSEEFPVEATVRSHVRRLRHKLTAAGAPHNFISTVHGRGYYLKPSVQELAPPTLSQNPLLEARSSQQKQAYLDFLNETWVTTKGHCLEQLSLLTQMAGQLLTNSLDAQQQQQAQQVVHKLVGTLGVFVLPEGIRLAQDLEVLLQHPLQPQDAPRWEELSLALTLVVKKTTAIELGSTPVPHSPLLWLIAPDSANTQRLISAATVAGMRTAIAPSPQRAKDDLLSEATLDHAKQPDVIVIQLPQEPSQIAPSDPSFSLYWQLLEMLHHHHPDRPIILMGKHLTLEDRRELNCRYSNILLESSTTPDTILKAIRQLLKWRERNTKIMVVDSDLAWLQTLPALLSPWGFKVSTLAEPKQFWTVLEAINPDVLLIDINLPDISGLELCQLLRSDLRWRFLPILFLSAIADTPIQQKAFCAGANDYLLKPIVGKALAQRIRNRLQQS